MVYGISSVFARFINYLLVPLYTGIFDPEAYGIVGLVYAAIAFGNVVFTIGMESSYLRYGVERKKSKDYFKSIQLFLLGTSFVLVILVWMLSPLINPTLGLESGSPIFWMMLGILFFDTISIVPFAELRLVQKAWTFASLKTLNVGINLGLNIYLILGLGYGIEAVFISNLAASIITALIVWGITIKQFVGQFDFNFLKKAMLFGLPFIPAGIGHAINEMLDRFFLKGMSEANIFAIYGEALSSEYIVGVYNACYKLGVFMLLLVQMYRMAWQPFFMRTSQDVDSKKVFAEAFNYFNVFAVFVLLSISLFVDQIVAIPIPFLDSTLIGDEYWMGLSIVPVLLMAYLFQGWYVNFSAGVFIGEKTKELAKITFIGASITIALNLLLVPNFGMMGSAVATLSSYLSMAMILLYYSKKSLNVPYSWIRNLSAVAIAAFLIYLKPHSLSLGIPDVILSLLFILVGTAIAWVLVMGLKRERV